MLTEEKAIDFENSRIIEPSLLIRYLDNRILSCCTIFFIGCWSIPACDYKPTDPKHISLLDFIWLFIITFTTVSKSLQELIEKKQFASIEDIDLVVAQKLELTLWYFKRKNQHRRSLQYLKSERLLYKSIHDYRQVKSEQRKLNENCSDFIESIHIQRYTSIKTKKILRDLTIMKLKIDKIEEKFTDINHTINNIHNTLNLLMKKNVE
jgi:hypothetical protein